MEINMIITQLDVMGRRRWELVGKFANVTKDGPQYQKCTKGEQISK